jgi:DNA-binding NarL/FixJ family response regulator
MRPEQEELLEELGEARRVLVVDDHPSFRRFAHALLTEQGFDVVGEAKDGVEALELVDELAPELVLLDVQMPDIDGFEVTTRLLVRDPALKIVLVSVHDRAEFGELVEKSGARGFISKSELTGPALRRLLE